MLCNNKKDLTANNYEIDEKTRKSIVKYIFLVYWLLIFEGALRKWAFPQYHEIIFFIRDPIALVIYIKAWRNNIITKDVFLTASTIISIIAIPLIFIQTISQNTNFLSLIYGWRMYFYYIPLAFVIKDSFLRDDLHKLIKQTLYVCVPLSVLIFIQYLSPAKSFINAAYGAGHVFVVANGIVRTTGTFSFTAGQTMFAASLMTMVIYVWVYRSRHALMAFPWLLVTSGAAITTLLLTGSRTAFFMTGLIVIATVTGLFFTRDAKLKLRGTSLLIFLLLLGTIMFLGPFKKSFDALGTRFEQAESHEGSAAGRAIAPFILFTQRINTTPAFGFGLGLGTSGGSKLATGKASITLAEDEWSRVLMETGPGFGFVYISYRIFFTIYLFNLSIKSARDDNDLLPMMLLGFIAYYLFNGTITGQGTIQGYNWLFVGLVMAAAKKHLPHPDETIASPKTLYQNIAGNR